MDTGDPVSGLADVDHGPDEPPGPLPLLRPAEVVDQRGQAALTQRKLVADMQLKQ